MEELIEELIKEMVEGLIEELDEASLVPRRVSNAQTSWGSCTSRRLMGDCVSAPHGKGTEASVDSKRPLRNPMVQLMVAVLLTAPHIKICSNSVVIV